MQAPTGKEGAQSMLLYKLWNVPLSALLCGGILIGWTPNASVAKSLQKAVLHKVAG